MGEVIGGHHWWSRQENKIETGGEVVVEKTKLRCRETVDHIIINKERDIESRWWNLIVDGQRKG